MDIKSKEILIEFTNRCSARCEICPREKLTRDTADMDFGLYKKIIDDASQYDIRMINTCGYGDVLLDSLLFQRLEYARQKLPEARVYVGSTCYYLDESMYEDVAKYVDVLKISFYGMSRETYEASHGGNLKFETSLRNVLGFLKYVQRREKKTHTVALLTVSDANKNDVDEFIGFWSPLVDEVMVWKPHNFGGGRMYREIDPSRQETCGRPFNGPPVVTVSGEVSVCCFDFNGQLIVGDTRTQSLRQIMHSEPFRGIRRAHEERKFEGLICNECCQTNYDPTVLLYASSEARAVGKENSALLELRKGVGT